MRPRFEDLQPVADHDSIELGDQPTRVEAPAAFRDLMMVREIFEAAPVRAPLVEISHQNSRQVPLPMMKMGEDRMCLASPP